MDKRDVIDDLNADAEHPKNFKEHDSKESNKAKQRLENELEAKSEEQIGIATEETMWMSAILWVFIIGLGVFLLWEYII
jgi:thiol:disulfide interchange protein